MIKPILKRLGSGAVVLWAAASAAYLALRLAPGDTVDTLERFYNLILDGIESYSGS